MARAECIPLAAEVAPDANLKGLDDAAKRPAEQRAVVERTARIECSFVEARLAGRPMLHPGVVILLHQRHEHPFRFAERSQMLLMFAVTPSANSFDYRRWLDEDQIITLGSDLPAPELDELMARLYVLHRQAYGYERGDNYLDVAPGLLECLEGKLINLRQTIRLATEIYDLCYAHPDFSATQAVAELRRAMLGKV